MERCLRYDRSVFLPLLFVGPFLLGVSPQGPYAVPPKATELAERPPTNLSHSGSTYIVPALPTGFVLEIDVNEDCNAGTNNCDWADLTDMSEKLSFEAWLPHFLGHFVISHSDNRLYVYVNVDDTNGDPNSGDNLVLMLDANNDHVANDNGLRLFRNGTVESVVGDPTSPTNPTPKFTSSETNWQNCLVRLCIRSLANSSWIVEGWLDPSDFGLNTFSGVHGVVAVAVDSVTGGGIHTNCDGTDVNSDRSCWPTNTDPNYWNHLILDPPELVLVFDVSGSMSWSKEGVPGVPEAQQRLRKAKNASKPFIDNMNAQYQGEAMFGIAAFPVHPWLPTTPCSGQIVTQMKSSTNAAVGIAAIENLTPGGNTPLLGGVQTALGMFSGAGQRVIVVLSDGYHNCPPGADRAPLIAAVDAASARVFTLGYGRPEDAEHLLLEGLASEPMLDGVFYNVTGQVDETAEQAVLTAAYKEVLTNALGLEQATDPRGRIAAGETDSVEVHLNEYDRRVSFFLSWDTRQRARLGLAVRSSDGELVPLDNREVIVSGGDTYTILTVGLRFLQLPGKVGANPWLIQISADSLDSGESETYLYSVNLNSGLKLRAELDRDSYLTGDVITLTSRVTTPAGAMSGLEQIYVDVTAPEDGAGNWFAGNSVSPAELSRIPDTLTNESLPPVLKKAIFLADFREVPFPGDLSPTRLPLFDDGTHGDLIPGDGEHTNRFRVLKEGSYAFQFRTVGTTDRGNGFQREHKVEEYVQVGVSPEASLINVFPVEPTEPGGTQFRIIITFKDSFGNFLGPRYARDIALSVSQGHLLGDVSDNLDGSYSQTLQLPPGVNPDEVDVIATVRGVRIPFNLGEQLEPSFELDGAAGLTIPTGAFDSNYDSGYRLQMSFGRRFGRVASAIAYAGYNWFRSGAMGVSDTHVWNFSGNLRVSTPTVVTMFVEAGPGVYIPESSSAKFGFNAGAGAGLSIAREWVVQLSGDYHRYLSTGSDAEFFTLQGGIVYRW